MSDLAASVHALTQRVSQGVTALIDPTKPPSWSDGLEVSRLSGILTERASNLDPGHPVRVEANKVATATCILLHGIFNVPIPGEAVQQRMF